MLCSDSGILVKFYQQHLSQGPKKKMLHILLIRSLIVQFQEPTKMTAPSKKLPPTGAKNGTPAISKEEESSDSSDSDSSSDEDIVTNLNAHCFLCYVKATKGF